MLALKSTVTQKADGTEIYFEIVNATGVYNAGTNPGGFGAPNKARNEVALLFYALHKKTDGDVEVSVNAYDALTVTQFTMPMDRDKNGHLETYVFAPNLFDPLGVYNNGDIVWDKENLVDQFPKKRVAGVWVRKTIADLIGESAAVVTLEKNELIIPQAKEFVDECNAAQQKLLREWINDNIEKDEYETLRNRFDFVQGLIATATDDFAAAAYIEAETKIEELLSYEDQLEEAA